MGFLQQKIAGLLRRYQYLQYGIGYLRSADFYIPSRLHINGSKRSFSFAAPADPAFVYEFDEICIKDCYQLRRLKKLLPQVNTISDIGANQGLFAIAARQNFSNAIINCYEPNTALAPMLSQNAEAVQATVFYEAVAKQDCTMNLQFGASDLHTVASPSATGTIQGTAFSKIIERAGGHIDLLKLDCEGGEWAIMEDTASWQQVGAVTMEYHCWAKPGSSAEEVRRLLQSMGFTIIAHHPLTHQFGLLTAMKK